MSTESETGSEAETCKICLMDMQDSQIQALDKLNNCSGGSENENSLSVQTFEVCKHNFHQDCLRQGYLVDIENSKFPLLCPEVDCKKEVSVTDLKKILSSKDMDLFYQRSF